MLKEKRRINKAIKRLDRLDKKWTNSKQA
jgi:hypothetical protein